MATTGDQFNQMIIFKDYLYKQFSKGNFFYDFQYMGGENFFTSLSYYYSTSLSFYLSSLITFILEKLGLITDINLVFWGKMILIVSIFRTSVIIFIMTKLLRYLNVNPQIAVFSSLFYALSPIYFHQTSLWEIFGDGFIWAPLLILGVEKIIRERKGHIFAIAIGLALFNNGYLAYINLLMTVIYIILRFFIHLTSNETDIIKQVKDYIIYGILGFLLGLPGFVPFVIGFFKTNRTVGNFDAPLFHFDPEIHNFVFTDEYQVVPILFVLLITFFPIYRNKNVRFFVLLTLFGILARYSPAIGSIMNGFSYPEERWLFLVPLFMSISLGMSLNTIMEGLNKKEVLFGFLISILTTFCIYSISSKIPLTEKQSLLVEYWPIFLVITSFLLVTLFINNKNLLPVLLLLSGVNLILLFDQNRQLYYDYRLYEVDELKIENTYQNDYLKITEIINDLENQDLNDGKIDFTELPLNLALAKNVSSYNIYSSFLNGSAQNFISELKILDQAEHLNRINSFGGRQVIYSLLNLDTVIAQDNNLRIPYAFSQKKYTEDYGETNIYVNNMDLPFIHPVRFLYSEDAVYNKNLDELMVNGAIVEDKYAKNDGDNRYMINEINYNLDIMNGKFEDNILSAEDSSNDIIVSLSFGQSDYDQIVVDYSLIPVNKNRENKYNIIGNDIDLFGFYNIYS